jgi:hypothetical protein
MSIGVTCLDQFASFSAWTQTVVREMDHRATTSAPASPRLRHPRAPSGRARTARKMLEYQTNLVSY